MKWQETFQERSLYFYKYYINTYVWNSIKSCRSSYENPLLNKILTAASPKIGFTESSIVRDEVRNKLLFEGDDRYKGVNHSQISIVKEEFCRGLQRHQQQAKKRTVTRKARNKFILSLLRWWFYCSLLPSAGIWLIVQFFFFWWNVSDSLFGCWINNKKVQMTVFVDMDISRSRLLLHSLRIYHFLASGNCYRENFKWKHIFYIAYIIMVALFIPSVNIHVTR